MVGGIDVMMARIITTVLALENDLLAPPSAIHAAQNVERPKRYDEKTLSSDPAVVVAMLIVLLIVALLPATASVWLQLRQQRNRRKCYAH